MATLFKAAVLGLLVVSATYADVVHLKDVKPNGKKDCVHAKNSDEYASASDNVDHFAAAFGAQSFGPSSTAAPPFAFDAAGSFSTTAAAPFKSAASSYGPPATPFAGSYSSDAAQTGSSPASFDGPFASPAAPLAVGSPEPVPLNRSPAFGAAYGAASFSAYAAPPPPPPPFAQGPTVVRTDSPYAGGPPVSVANGPAPGNEVTINREVPVPYYVQVERRVPYPVLVRVPHPYAVTVEKHVPYAVRVNVDRPVPVPQPYPVTVEKRVPYPVERPVPVEVRVPVDRPYPVHVPYDKPVPYAVEKPVPYPVRVNVDRPYPVERPVPYPVPVDKPVPYAVERPVPYPVEKRVPYPVEKRVPYPVKYEVPVNVPVPVEVKVPVTVDRPVPYPVETRVPYPVQVPYEVRVPVPVRAPVQRFATVHYYQQSPVVVGYGAQSVVGQSGGYKASSGPAPVSGYVSAPGPVSSYGAAAAAASPTAFNVAQQGFAGLGEGQKNVDFGSANGFGQQTYFGTSTSAPFNAFSAGSSSAGVASSSKTSDFDSIAQQAVAISGSAIRSQTENLGQQTYFGTSTPAPFDGFPASSTAAVPSSYTSSDFDAIAQQAVAIGGSAIRSQTENLSQQSYFGTSTPSPFSGFSTSSTTAGPSSYTSSDFDAIAQQAVAIGGSAIRSQRDNLEGGRK